MLLRSWVRISAPVRIFLASQNILIVIGIEPEMHLFKQNVFHSVSFCFCLNKMESSEYQFFEKVALVFKAWGAKISKKIFDFVFYVLFKQKKQKETKQGTKVMLKGKKWTKGEKIMKKNQKKNQRKKLRDWYWIHTLLEYISLSTHFLQHSLGYVHCLLRFGVLVKLLVSWCFDWVLPSHLAK